MAKKRSAKQKAAFARMRAGLKKYRAGKKTKTRRTKRRKVRSVVLPKSESLLITKGEIMGTRRRKRKHTSHKRRKRIYSGLPVMGRRHRVHHRRKRHYLGGKNEIVHTLMEGAGVVGGAVGASMLAKLIPVSNAKIKAAIPIALGLGIGFTKFGRKGIVKDAALGSITIGMISLLKSFVPTLPLLSGDVELMGYLPTGEQQAMLGQRLEGEVLEGDLDGELDGDFDGDFDGDGDNY